MKVLIFLLVTFGFIFSQAGEIGDPYKGPHMNAKDDLRDYLNSLSAEDLSTLNFLREEIEEEVLAIARLSFVMYGSLLGMSGALLSAGVLVDESKRSVHLNDVKLENVKGKVTKYIGKVRPASAAVLGVSFGALATGLGVILATTVSVFADILNLDESLFFDRYLFEEENDEVLRSQIREAISDLSLDQARKILYEAKKFRSELEDMSEEVSEFPQ